MKFDQEQSSIIYFEKENYQKLLALFIGIYAICLIALSLPVYANTKLKYITLLIFGGLFSLEYLAKVVVSVIRGINLKWTGSFLAIVDLIAILSFLLSFFFHYNFLFLRILRVVRVFSIFRDNPVSQSIDALTKVINKKKYDLMASFIILSVLVLIASCAIYCFENTAQPEKFASIIHSFWWAVITMTTVGYGDIYPVTVGGKIIASLFSAIGFGFIALPAAIISTGYLKMRDSYVCEKCSKTNKLC